MRAAGLTTFALFAALAVSTAGCARHALTGAGVPLPAVPPVAGAPLPAWVAAIAPTGKARDGAQIRVIFRDDLVPLQALESASTRDALAHVALEPALPGRFVLLTPRMVGFVADAPLPHATRVKVSLHAGLRDVRGDTLAHDYAWTFQTAPLRIDGLPNENGGGEALVPTSLRPTIGIDTSTAVDQRSLLAHAALVDRLDERRTIALEVAPTPAPSGSPSASPAPTPSAYGPAQPETSSHYDLRPVTALARGRAYDIEIAAGVAPLRGNVPSQSAARGALRTYNALAFEGVTSYGTPATGGAGRFTSGAPLLRFSTPIVAASAQTAIQLVPAPQPRAGALGLDEDGNVRIDPSALRPATRYDITIARTLTDRFGQHLGAPAHATFTTGDLLPDIWAPEGFALFPASLDLSLDVQTTNLPSHRFRFATAAIAAHDLVANDVALPDAQLAFLAQPGRWPNVAVPTVRNQTIDHLRPLRTLLRAPTGMLAYAAAARTFQIRDASDTLVWQNSTFGGIVQVSDIGLYLQWLPDEALVRTARLSDGAPLRATAIAIYPSRAPPYLTSQKRRTLNQAPCATGATDATGTFALDRASVARCAVAAERTSPPEGDDEAPALLVIAQRGTDWTWARTQSYQYADVALGWSAGTPHARGAIVSDRDLYQPGERAAFAAVAYFERNGTLGRAHSRSFRVALITPSGERRALGSRTLDPFGAFSLVLTLEAHAQLGYYQITATGDDGESLDGSFRVARFKPPNFRTTLDLDAHTVAAGATVHASTRSDYLFGAPVEAGRSHADVTRAQTTFAAPGWDAFTFGRSWDYPDEPPSVAPDVLQRDATLGKDGTGAFAIDVARDLPYAMTYTVESQTTDVSNLAVSATKTFTALPSSVMIGLKTSFVAQAGEPFDIATVVVGIDGKPLVKRLVELVLQRREFLQATQEVEGGTTPHDAVHYIDVAHANITSGTAPRHARLTAPQPGSYRVHANVAQASNDASVSDVDVFVAGAGEADWGASTQSIVKLDRATYHMGDTAHALVESPYPEADLFLAVVRHGVIDTIVRHVHGGAPRVAFPITVAMLPNAAALALLVRRGAPLDRRTVDPKERLARVGLAPFSVALDDEYLKIALHPRTPSVAPGGAQHVHVHLNDRRGRPVQGELALAVVDDAILQLTSYRFPDLTPLVYSGEPISLRFADDRDFVRLAPQTRALEKGFGFGGGALLGPGSTRVRTHFAPLAYWNGAVRTNASGDADVAFTVPDDLTTWRVMALAYDRNARFATTDTTFIATKALVTNPLLPQFARVDDTFFGGVAATDTVRGGGTYSVDGTLGAALAFASPANSSSRTTTANGAAHTTTTSAPAGAFTQAFRFGIVAQRAGDARVTFATRLGTNADAFAVSLPIESEGVTESVVTSGATQTSARVPLAVDPARRSPLAGLDVTLASTLLGDVQEPRRRLAAQATPFLATELAARIAVEADSLLLRRRYGEPSDSRATRARIAHDLGALDALGLPDGSVAPWGGARDGDVFTTAFVAVQLGQARRAGIDVTRELRSTERFLAARLADPFIECARHDATCAAELRLEALETFGLLGQPRSDFLSDIDAHRDAFGYYERVELARHLIGIGAWHARGIALRDKLLEQLYETGRRAEINVPGEFGESPTAGQAQILGLLVASHARTDEIDKALATLLALRRNGTWPCACDDAEALNALVLYAAQDRVPPNFVARATLAGGAAPSATAFEARFRGYRFATKAMTIPYAKLPAGRSDVAFEKHGKGTLRYVVALRYAVSSTAPGMYAGIRIDRIVHAPQAGGAQVAAFGLVTPPASVSLSAGRVFAIDDVVTLDHGVENLTIEDPLPAGLEAIDETFSTSPQTVISGWDDWNLDNRTIDRDRVTAFASHLAPGVYALHYLVRSVTPGDYAWPGARAYLQYAPEEFGRTSTSRLRVVDASL